MIVKFLKDSWLVLLAALVFGLGVSGIYGQLKPRIEQNAQLKIARELKELFGEDAMIDPKIDPEDSDGKRVLYYQANRSGQTLGYALEAVGGGFADNIRLLLAVDAEFEKLKGIAVLKSNETPGFGDKIKDAEFKGQFGDCPVGQKLIVTKSGERSVVDEKIVSITGATISSQAVVDIVNGGVERLREIVK
ncbi:MAG: FMN-binding protein [Sedimentisphaerales bacterium]|nr:FMN-binding protein [Sedimentisphaerales bacterium]